MIGTATNNSGYYSLSGLVAGTHTLQVSYIGYEPLEFDVTLAAGETLRRDLDLEPLSLEVAEVVVTADADTEEEQRRLGVSKMPTATIRQLPTILEPDVFRSLQLLPGVKSASDFSSGLYIRGGSPDQTLILLDRTTVYNPTHFFGVFSTFNPDAIKDVRLYKGAYGSEYGGRIGSVVDIYNKDGNRRSRAGSVSLGLLASRAMIEGPHRKGSWMLALRRSTVEPLLT
ncbi:MAG: TonB-dependent receptor, partial [Bacteroidota bacterium]|nr:TonB-dependent receptor [Bacteroidota bacterium]